jgi:hypothetical protein
MFTLRVRDPFGSRGMSCVKLPSAVAFPTDPRLLDRLEQSRRALPPNSVKALWKSGERCQARPGRKVREVAARAEQELKITGAAISRLPVRAETVFALPQLVRIEELYPRSRVALGKR